MAPAPSYDDPDSLRTRPWYQSKITDIDPLARQMLEERGVPADQVLEHVQKVREQAWVVFPYPCIGMFSFVKMLMSKQPMYPQVLERLLHKNETLLDLGCGFAQELRPLISAGVPATNLFGLDVVDGFINQGFELFRDKEVLGSRFYIADLLQGVPVELERGIDIIFAASFFHLFDWDQQVLLSKHAVKMLKPQLGSLIWGFQLGRETEGTTAAPGLPSGKVFHHTPESFKRMWKIIGEETGISWKVDCTDHEITDVEGLGSLYAGLRFLRYSVELFALDDARIISTSKG